MGQILRGANAPGVSSKGFFGPLLGSSGGSGPPFGSWTAVSPAPGSFYQGACAGLGTIVITGNVGTFQVEYSTDGGRTWNATSNIVIPGPNRGAVFDPVSGHYIVTGTFSAGATHVYYSSDGHTWTQGPSLDPLSSPCETILTDGAGLLVAGLGGSPAGGNYFTSINGGASWTQQNTYNVSAWGSGGTTQQTGVWDGTRFIQLVRDASTGFVSVAAGSDGVHWSTLRAFTSFWNASLTFFNHLYFITRPGSNTILTATDPTLFNPAAAITLTALIGQVSALGTDGVRAFAFDQFGNVMSTSDGVTWFAETLNFALSNGAFNLVTDTQNGTVVALAGGLGKTSLSVRTPL